MKTNGWVYLSVGLTLHKGGRYFHCLSLRGLFILRVVGGAYAGKQCMVAYVYSGILSVITCQIIMSTCQLFMFT